MTQQVLLIMSLIVLFIGFFFLALAGGVFDWRALTNKRAWNGMTLPFLFIGIVIFILGLVMVYFFFPR